MFVFSLEKKYARLSCLKKTILKIRILGKPGTNSNGQNGQYGEVERRARSLGCKCRAYKCVACDYYLFHHSPPPPKSPRKRGTTSKSCESNKCLAMLPHNQPIATQTSKEFPVVEKRTPPMQASIPGLFGSRIVRKMIYLPLIVQGDITA